MDESNYKTLNEKWGLRLGKFDLAEYLGMSYASFYRKINEPYYLDDLLIEGYNKNMKMLEPKLINIILQKYFGEDVDYFNKNKKIQS